MKTLVLGAVNLYGVQECIVVGVEQALRPRAVGQTRRLGNVGRLVDAQRAFPSATACGTSACSAHVLVDRLKDLDRARDWARFDNVDGHSIHPTHTP